MASELALKYAVSIQTISAAYDWICVRRMLQEHAAEVTQWFEHESIVDLQPELRRELKDPAGYYQINGVTVLLARLHGVCTGLVALRRLDGDTAEVGRLYARPEGKKAGAEALLLGAALATAYDRGIRRVVLDEFATSSEAGITFVESAGFIPVAANGGRTHARLELVLDKTRSTSVRTGGNQLPRWMPAQRRLVV